MKLLQLFLPLKPLRLFLPQDLPYWIGTILFLGFFYYYCKESILSVKGVVFLLISVAIVVALAIFVPIHWVKRIALTHPFIRGTAYGLIAYIFIASLGLFPEIWSFRNWWELLTLTKAAPFSLPHVFGIIAAFLAAFTQVRYFERKYIKAKVVRGPELIPHEEAVRITEEQLGPNGKGFLWGAVRLPFSSGTGHFCIVGEPGSGKTKSIQILLKSVLGSIQPGSNRRAILYDAKRDMISTLKSFGITCPVRTLHPFDKRGYAWDIAGDITDPMVGVEIATILIPEKIGENQPYFPNAARALLSGVMESFLRTAPGKWTLRDLVLALRYARRVKHLLRVSTSTRYLIEKFVTEKTSDKDVESTIENSMRRLSFVAAGWELARGKVNFEEWVETGESILILGSSPIMESTFKELNRALLVRLGQVIEQQPNADRAGDGRPWRQHWIVIDELSGAGKLDRFNEIMKAGRSKGACIVLGFQDLHSLEEVYGPNLGRELVGICLNKAFLRTTDPYTQKYASDCFGTQEVELPRTTWSESKSQTSGQQQSSYSHTMGESHSSQRITQPVVLPSQFGSDLHQASRRKGISGFYMTDAVGQPYFGNLPGHFIEKMLPEIRVEDLSEEELDFVPRFPRGADVSLKEWTMEDLKRLNLEGHPELLETDEDGGPGEQDWGGILRDR